MNTDFAEVTWVAERLPNVGDPDGIATDHARLALLEHISPAPPRRRRRLGLRLAAVGAVAAAAGVTAIFDGPARPTATGTTTVPRVAIAAGHHPADGHPVLLRLADDVTQAPAPPGNAALVIRHESFPAGHQSPITAYDLYEDNGATYSAPTPAELRQALRHSSPDKIGPILTAAARSADLSPAQAAHDIYQSSPAPSSVAKYEQGLRTALAKITAVNGSPSLIQSIRQRLDEVSNATPSRARRLARPDRATVDNYLWMNCEAALTGGAGRVDIRAGAMLALSTLPDVDIQHTTFDGRSVVQITNRQFSDDYTETLDLDAQTGVLAHMSGGTLNKPASVDITYTVTRVTAPSLDPSH